MTRRLSLYFLLLVRFGCSVVSFVLSAFMLVFCLLLSLHFHKNHS